MEKKSKVILIILLLYSAIILAIAYLIGIHEGEGYKGYFYKYNWSLYIFFWIPVVLFWKATWRQFIKAWQSLFNNGCIRSKDRNIPDSTALEKFLIEISDHQKYILIISFILASIVMIIDTSELRVIYFNKRSITIYKTITIKNKTEVTEYFLSKQNEKKGMKVENLLFSEVPKGEKIKDATWTEAWLFQPHHISEWGNLTFVLFAYIQQYVIVFIGFLSLFNIWAHLIYFYHFDSLKSSKANDLRLNLDPFSNLYEFGLERWNQSLNTIYWLLSPVLIIPIISKSAQEGTQLDVGQVMIKWVVPLLFLSPMLFTIIVRQKKVMGVWEIIRNEKDQFKIELYHKQLIWPLDKNWASKLGILLSFGILTYLIGDILSIISATNFLK